MRLLAPLVLLSSASCASLLGSSQRPALRSVQTEEETFAGTTKVHDPYKKLTTIYAPDAYFRLPGSLASGSDLCSFRMRGWPGRREVQLVITFRFDDWWFLDEARDADGIRLNFSEIERDVGYGCVRETIGVNVDRDYLRNRVDQHAGAAGWNLAVYGKYSTPIGLVIPNWYVRGCLRALEQHDAQ